MISGSKQKYAFDLVALQGEASPSGVNVLTALPTQNVDQFISYGLVDVFVQMHGELQGDLATCFASKCYDMMVDAVRFCRMGAELSYCASHDLEPIYDPAQNKIISYLQVGGDAPPTFIQDFWKRPDQSGWKGVARIVKRRAEHLIRERFVSADTHDLLFPNALLNEYLCAHDDKTLGLYPYHYPWPRTTGQTTTDVADIAQRFVDVLVPRFRAAVGGVSVYEENVVRALRYVLVWHLEQALADLKTLQDGWLLKHKQGTLIGGTPKYLGRLLSALYRREGKEVWRFSHGGERGLYSDYHWGICELTEATRYFMHGAGEARLVDGRLKSGELPMITTAPRMDASPSQRHLNIFKRATGQAMPKGGGKIVYVCGSYLSEIGGHFPAFKLPDPKYYEWQIWLLRTLRERGLSVSVKMHPKGALKQQDFLAQFSDDVLTGPFEELASQASCFLFDFAGSAFMDALAMRQNVVFFDPGNRPMDADGRVLLKKRVHLVECQLDAAGRLRADEDRMIEAVGAARDGDGAGKAEAFVQDYFA